jgi:hypothetical protein
MSASGTPATQRVKEEEGEEEVGDEFIKIKVKDTNRFRVIFKMRKTDRLQALFDFFYDSMPTVSRGTGRFLVDDVRIACSSQFDQKTDLMEETRQLYFNTPLTSRSMRGFF